jgi:hypothetical protein
MNARELPNSRGGANKQNMPERLKLSGNLMLRASTEIVSAILPSHDLSEKA